MKHVCLRDMYKCTGQNPLFSKLYYTDKTSNKLTKMTSHLHILLSCIHHSVNNMFWWLTFFMFTHGNWISWPLILSDRPPVKHVTVFKLERSQVNLNGYFIFILKHIHKTLIYQKEVKGDTDYHQSTKTVRQHHERNKTKASIHNTIHR